MLSRRAVALSLLLCCRCSRHAKSWQRSARFAHLVSWAALFRAIQPVCCHLHSILFKCNACGSNVGLPAACRPRLGLCKDNASERKASGLAISRVRLILCKDNASERKASGLAISRVRLILCKDNASERKASGLAISRVRLILCKDNASERKASGLAISRVRLILCKDNASERKASGLAISRAQLILCKGSTNRCNFKMFSSNNRFEPLPGCGSRRVAVWRHGHGKQAIMVKYAYRGPVLLASMPFCIAKRPFSPANTCRSACR